MIVPDAGLPSVEAATCSAFLDTGAYQDGAASNFNALPRPGTVLVTRRSEAELIRRHETLADVFARDLIPERLRGEPDAAATPTAGRPPASTTSRSPAATSTLARASTRDVLGLALRARGDAEGGEFAITGIANPKVRVGRPDASATAGCSS